MVIEVRQGIWASRVMRIAARGTETGAVAMLVLSYWEQARALLTTACSTKPASLKPARVFRALGVRQGDCPAGSRAVREQAVSRALGKKQHSGVKLGSKAAHLFM